MTLTIYSHPKKSNLEVQPQQRLFLIFNKKKFIETNFNKPSVSFSDNRPYKEYYKLFFDH